MDANLNIVQSYSDSGNTEKASNEIQKMLDDSKFSVIHPKLQLELVQLRITEGEIDQGIAVLNDIIIKYPKSESSAEANYLLGEEYLLHKRDFEKAGYFYLQVKEEMPTSKFLVKANKRFSELTLYANSLASLKDIIKRDDPSTLSIRDSVQIIDTSEVVLTLYNCGEMDALQFGQVDTAIMYFKQLIKLFPNNELEAKTLYALSYLYRQIGDTTNSNIYQQSTVKKYPDSEYAENIRETNSQTIYGEGGFTQLSEAEELYKNDNLVGLEEFKKISSDNSSEPGTRALLFVAHEYDYNLFDADSAKKYYNLLTIKYPESDQANLARSRLNKIKIAENKAEEKDAPPKIALEDTSLPVETPESEMPVVPVDNESLKESEIIIKEEIDRRKVPGSSDEIDKVEETEGQIKESEPKY